MKRQTDKTADLPLRGAIEHVGSGTERRSEENERYKWSFHTSEHWWGGQSSQKNQRRALVEKWLAIKSTHKAAASVGA